MSSAFGRWFGYGFGAAVGRAIFGEDRTRERSTAPMPPRTEEDFREDEKRYDEDEKRLETEAKDAAKK